ncbi:MAG: hypothetical protein M1356_09235 [Gammaproteobacteria bacterium]|nr:hypothetical protein [Gammaproteobacteria bacterium]
MTDNNNALVLRGDADLQTSKELGSVFLKSGYFKDTASEAQAIVKVIAGRELGFQAFASMSGLHIIQGKIEIGANMMASKVKASGKYNYKVKELDDSKCAIEYFENMNGTWESIGVSTFTIEDAKKAGTQNLQKFPRNMLFARAMSNGVRWFCPDVFDGNTVYTAGEIRATSTDETDVIDVDVMTGEIVQPEDVEPAQPHQKGQQTASPVEPDTVDVRTKQGIAYIKQLWAKRAETEPEFSTGKRQGNSLKSFFGEDVKLEGLTFEQLKAYAEHLKAKVNGNGS